MSEPVFFFANIDLIGEDNGLILSRLIYLIKVHACAISLSVFLTFFWPLKMCLHKCNAG